MTVRTSGTYAKVSGIAGLLGAALFTGSVVVLHVARGDIDWQQDYVSHFAHGRLGWLFIWGAVVHGLGNLALGQGLRGSLADGRLRASAVFFFGIAAGGVLLAGLLPIDPIETQPTFAGQMHRGVVCVAFLSELVALFCFSVAFGRNPGWRRRSRTSFVLSAMATLALAGFLAALVLHRMLGMAERGALTTFMVWEFWIALCLIRSPSGACDARAD